MSATEVNIFDEATARRLWEERRQRVADAEPGETIDFSDMEFSDDPADQYFREVEFHAIADFTGSIFQIGGVFSRSIFHRDAIFNNTVFNEKDDFPSVIFKDNVSFDEAIFNRAVGFHSNFQRNVSFERAVFLSEALFGHPSDSYFKDLGRLKFDSSLSFDNAEFRDAASFDNLDFDGNVSFKSTKFCYWTEFEGLVFNDQVSFEDAHFLRCTDSRDKRRNLVRFQEVKFSEKASFLNCKFECKVRFQKVIFDNISEFISAKFDDHVEFIDVKTNGRLLLERNYSAFFANCENAIVPYRLAKLSATSAGDLRWAGHYHYQEQCASNEYERKSAAWIPWYKEFWKRSKNGFLLWGEFFIGRLLFGYGEKPLRPLCVGAIVVFICGVIFWVTKGIDHNPPCSFLSSMYFSIVTFTTLGYGDLKPAPGMRWLAGTEAFLGAALMALFIVALSRKFSR